MPPVLGVEVEKPLEDVEVRHLEEQPWLLVFTLNDMHLGPAMLQPLILHLFSPKIPLFNHLLVHIQEWVSEDGRLVATLSASSL